MRADISPTSCPGISPCWQPGSAVLPGQKYKIQMFWAAGPLSSSSQASHSSSPGRRAGTCCAGCGELPPGPAGSNIHELCKLIGPGCRALRQSRFKAMPRLSTSNHSLKAGRRRHVQADQPGLRRCSCLYIDRTTHVWLSTHRQPTLGAQPLQGAQNGAFGRQEIGQSRQCRLDVACSIQFQTSITAALY